MRLANRVGTTTKRMAAMAGVIQPGFSTGEATRDWLASMASVPIATVEAMAYGPSGRFAHHRFGPGSVHREILDLSARRVCPACLEEADHHRRAWDLALATACPRHGLRLLSRCPGCSRRLMWSDPAPILCRCGFSLTTAAAEPVGVEETVANGRFLELANARLDWLPPEVQGCPSPDLMWLTMCLGMFVIGWPGERRIETLCKGPPAVTAAVVIGGLRCLEDWPLSLAAFLDAERRRAGERLGRYGARKALGPFYAWLRGVELPQVKEMVLAVVRSTVADDPMTVHRMHRSRLIGRQSEGLSALAQAAAVLGTSTATAKRMLERDAVSEGRGMPMAIPVAAIERLAAAGRGKLTLAETAAQLGVSKSRTRRLISAGTFGAAERTASHWTVEGEAVRKLLSGLEGGVVVAGVGPQVGFDHVAEAMRRRGVDLPGTIQAIRSGRIRAVGVDAGAVGLKRLVFNQAMVRAVCRGFDRSTIQVAAERMGLKWEVVRHLLERGLLAGTDAASVAAFDAEFVSGATLAVVRRTSPRALAVALARDGVEPVTGPGVDGGRQNFYAKSRVAHAKGAG